MNFVKFSDDLSGHKWVSIMSGTLFIIVFIRKKMALTIQFFISMKLPTAIKIIGVF